MKKEIENKFFVLHIIPSDFTRYIVSIKAE